MLHVVLLVLLATAAVQAAPQTVPKAARWAARLGLSGLPPFGLFPSLLLVAFAAGRICPLALIPFGAGLLAWVAAVVPGLRQRPETARGGGVRAAAVWVELAMAALLGLAAPAPVSLWLARLGETLQ